MEYAIVGFLFVALLALVVGEWMLMRDKDNMRKRGFPESRGKGGWK